MIAIFRMIAKLEGLSLLILLFFAMPMKYMFHNQTYVKTVGMAHGIFFIGYITLAIYLKIVEKWNETKTIQVVLASVVPFGTFIIEKKYFKPI